MRARKVLLLGSMCAFITSLNQSIMAVAFPDLRRSFEGVSDGNLSWILNAYTIVAGATLVLSAVISGRYGRKRVLLSGLALFTVAAIVCTAAPNVAVLITARVVQALGWALITPSALAVIIAEVPEGKRASAIATWGGVGGVATSLGPSVGAWLIELASWRMAFAVSIPFCVFVFVAGRRLFREAAAHELRRDGLPDVLSAFMLLIGVTTFILGLVQSPRWGWFDARTIGCLVAGVALIALLIWRSTRVRVPVLDPRLLRHRNLRLAFALAIGYGTGFFATNLGLVLFLTQVWDFSVVRAGLLVTPVAAMVPVMAPIAGRVADRYGHRRLIVPAGIAWIAGSLWLLIGATEHRSVWGVWMPAALLLGAGSGLGWPTIHALPVMGIPTADVSAATATNQTVLRVMGALGVAISVTLISGADGHSALVPFRRLFVLMAVSGVLLSAIGSLVRTAPAPVTDSTV